MKERRLALQEFIWRGSGLLQYGAQSPFRHVPGMVGNSRVTTGRLTVAETGQPSHQEPTTNGKSKESASSGSEAAC